VTAAADGLLRCLQVQTPLEEAKQLSAQLGNTILLKREDMQQVTASRTVSCMAGLKSPLGLVHTRCTPAQVFSFKLRGAFNKMAQLTPEELARGVITSSAGNHAQGVALAASHLVSRCDAPGHHAALPFPLCSCRRSVLWHPSLLQLSLPLVRCDFVPCLKVCCPVQGCEALICMPVTTPQIKVDAVWRLGGTVQLVGESYTETQSHAWVRDPLPILAEVRLCLCTTWDLCARSCTVYPLVCT
jgi:threonine dehydratase